MVVCSATACATASASRFLPDERQCLAPHWALGALVGGVTDPALACLSLPPFWAAADALSTPSSPTTVSSIRVVGTIFGRISQKMNAGA
jgi:hypothetical protein